VGKTERFRYGPQPRITAGLTASWLIGIFAAYVLVRGMINGSIAATLSVVGLLLLAAWAVLWWRHRRRGVYVSDTRVWVKRVFRTDSAPLTAVTVDTAASKPAGVRRLVLDLDGRRVPAPLRGFGEGRDDPYGPRDVLTSEQLGQVLNDLAERGARRD
jgi:hypothetical protein